MANGSQQDLSLKTVLLTVSAEPQFLMGLF